MNDMIVHIENSDISVKEYNGQRVVTFKDIDLVHGRPDGTARKRFNDNREHLIINEDYFVRKTDEAKKEYGITAPNGLVLLTEQGYLMLVKSFTDDLAWKVQRQLVNTYFKQSETIDRTKLSPQLQLMNLLVENMNKQELEQKRQAEALQRLEDKTNKQTEALQTVKDTFSKSETEEETVQWVNHCINKIAESPNFVYSFGNRYAAAKNESYNRLSTKAGCRLDQKLRNSIARAEERGYTKAQINTINKLSVIMADKRLKQIYIGVIKEMMIVYCVEIA